MKKMIQLVLWVALGHLALPAGEPAMKTVTVTTMPKFEQHDRFTHLMISNAQHHYEISWAMPPKLQFVPVSLATNKVYTFTVVEAPFHQITIPKLHKIQQGTNTLYDIEVCEVHKTRMEHRMVPIYYGLIRPAPGEPSAEIEKQLFPHLRDYSLGGCVVTDDSPKTKRRYVCSRCQAAYEKWKSDHQKTK